MDHLRGTAAARAAKTCAGAVSASDSCITRAIPPAFTWQGSETQHHSQIFWLCSSMETLCPYPHLLVTVLVTLLIRVQQVEDHENRPT